MDMMESGLTLKRMDEILDEAIDQLARCQDEIKDENKSDALKAAFIKGKIDAVAQMLMLVI